MRQGGRPVVSSIDQPPIRDFRAASTSSRVPTRRARPTHRPRQAAGRCLSSSAASSWPCQRTGPCRDGLKAWITLQPVRCRALLSASGWRDRNEPAAQNAVARQNRTRNPASLQSAARPGHRAVFSAEEQQGGDSADQQALDAGKDPFQQQTGHLRPPARSGGSFRAGASSNRAAKSSLGGTPARARTRRPFSLVRLLD